MFSSRRPLFPCRDAAGALLLLLLGACAAHVPPPPPPKAAQCLAELDRRGVQYRPATVSAAAGPCAVDNPVSVTRTETAWSQSGIVSCAFALRLESFEREVVQPLALARFGKRVRLIRHFGTYACRETAGGRWSQHAAGDAIDIAGFVLDDGTPIMVAQDWRRRGRKRAFLQDVARAACRRFSVVLTPDSDRDHWNHIHLDGGPYHWCGNRAAITPAPPPAARAARGASATGSAGSDPSR